MIPVVQQSEPQNFDNNVRLPGKKFLTKKPSPISKEFQRKNYWKNALNDLHTAYKGVCAYTCMYLPDPGSVDHFLPKSKYPQLAYEWSNFRLAAQRVNSHKGDSTDVVDPFTVQTGWFVLDIPSCLIRPGNGLPAKDVEKIRKTIEALKLNDDDDFVQKRCDLMLEYADGNFTLDFLSKQCPFLAAEIIRQGIQNTVTTIFKRRSP